MNQIQINQNENQLITISNKELQNIDINQDENQLITISNKELQNIDVNQNENQLIYISNEGSAIGISNVLVNGVSVVSGNVAYVIVPTKTSELQNDSGYITYETDPTVPGYIKTLTLNDINKWNSKQDQLVSGINIKTINNTSLLGSGNIEIEGSSYTAGTGIEITSNNVINNKITSYNDLSNLPNIPTKTSDLLNDNNFVDRNSLADVAFSGSYLDLIDDPVIPQNTSDLYNDSGFITNTVDDLTNYTTTSNLNTLLNDKQDTLVSGTNIKTINGNSLLGSGDITVGGGGGTATDVQINGTSITSNNVANILTETAYNPTTNKIATVSDLPTIPTIPTKTSDLTNDSNFAVTNADNNFTANQTINGMLTATGTVIGGINSGIAQLRAVANNYGFFIRNDDSTTYFMLTNSGDPNGSWNSLRPIYINNSNGRVGMGNGLDVAGALTRDSRSVATMKELYSNTSGSQNVDIGESTSNYNYYIIVWGNTYNEKRTDIFVPDFGGIRLDQFATTGYYFTYTLTNSGNNIILNYVYGAGWGNTGKIYKIIGVKF